MAANRYPEGLVAWVKENYKSLTLPELTEECNAKFGTDMNKSAMSSLKKRYGLTGAPRAKAYSETFPEEICRFIRDNYEGTGHQQMADLIKQHFGREYTAQQIKSYYANHGLNCGLTGRFVKGQPSHNKGKRMSPEMYEKAKATMFKPGNRPHNAKEVGDIAPTTEGYYRVKVAEPDAWEFCHIRAWQQAHGEIPEGMVVSFKDGDKRNWNLENLMLITQGENGLLNSGHLRSSRAELTECGLLVVKMSQAATRRRKKKNGGISNGKKEETGGD